MNPPPADVPTSATSPSVEVESAVADAAAAASRLAAMSPNDRAELLEAVAAALSGAADELVAIADVETALGEARLEGEVARTTGQLRLFSEVLREGSYLEAVIDRADPAVTPPKPDLRRQLIPLGPVAVFTASNFPFAFSVAGGDTASALAAGCPVVVKAHPGHPRLSRRTAAIVQEVLREAGAPQGTLTHVEGHEAGRSLVVAPQIKAAAFTGSLSGGRALFDLASGREDPIPFYGELGSINPVVITPAAAANRSEEIATQLAQSFTMGVGQFCTKPGVVFVPAESEIAAALGDAVKDTPPARMLVDRMLTSFQQGTQDLERTEGVRLVAGSVQGADDSGATPMVFDTDTSAVLRDPDRLLAEQFGPAVLLVRYDSIADLMETLQVVPGALTASIHAEPQEFEQWLSVVERLRSLAGRLIFDGWPTGVAVTWAMQHGGPWPATTNALHTSVGATAIRRFLRPIVFQSAPTELLPPALRDANPLGIPRRVDGHYPG